MYAHSYVVWHNFVHAALNDSMCYVLSLEDMGVAMHDHSKLYKTVNQPTTLYYMQQGVHVVLCDIIIQFASP